MPLQTYNNAKKRPLELFPIRLTEPIRHLFFKKMQILPLDNLILYSKIKFMHNFTYSKRPFSFQGTWMRNMDRNPILNLRHANDYYILPAAFTSLKRLPLFTFPSLWNGEHVSKSDQNSKSYLRSLKKHLIDM